MSNLMKPIGFDSAKAHAVRNKGDNMTIAATLVVEITNLIEQQQQRLTELESELRSHKQCIENMQYERDALAARLDMVKQKLESAHSATTHPVAKEVLCHEAWQIAFNDDCNYLAEVMQQ